MLYGSGNLYGNKVYGEVVSPYTAETASSISFSLESSGTATFVPETATLVHVSGSFGYKRFGKGKFGRGEA